MELKPTRLVFDYRGLAQAVRKATTGAGHTLTVTQIAREIGVSRTTLYDYMAGRYWPKRESSERLELLFTDRIFWCPVDEISGRYIGHPQENAE